MGSENIIDLKIHCFRVFPSDSCVDCTPNILIQCLDFDQTSASRCRVVVAFHSLVITKIMVNIEGVTIISSWPQKG